MSKMQNAKVGDKVVSSGFIGEQTIVEVRHEREFGKQVDFYVLQTPKGYRHTTDFYHLEMNYKKVEI